jgi:ribosome maturation factor RimP
MELLAQIQQIAEEQLVDPSLFIVSIELKEGGKSKLEILIDGDQGVGIDDCAIISRKIGNIIEEQNLLDKAYQLEVSTPGVGQPLKMIRQYKANIGRDLKVFLENGIEINGTLKEVNEDKYLLETGVKEKNKKKLKIVPVWVPFSDVKLAKVKVSFK